MTVYTSFKGNFKKIRNKDKNLALYRATLKDQDNKKVTIRSFIEINFESKLAQVFWDSNNNKKFDNNDLLIAFRFDAIPEGKRAVKHWKKYKRGKADIVDQVKTYGSESFSEEHPTFFRFTQPKALRDEFNQEQLTANPRNVLT